MRKKWQYILGWSLFSVLYEQVARWSGFFYYHGWKWWYSLLCYPFIMWVLIGNLYFVRGLQKKSKNVIHKSSGGKRY